MIAYIIGDFCYAFHLIIHQGDLDEVLVEP